MGQVILIVEDEPRNLKLIWDLLEVSGYMVLEAIDGKQAVEIAKAEKPDLILMDLQLPVMDGFEATRILKADERTRDIPIVALTAYAMKGDEGKVRAVGFNGYIPKPIDTRGFLNKITEYLARQ
ncbi:MAG: response regulator [Deltaproteobacteria bacterium]|nr:response regulator [Deltaproteobacteria bacterium]